MRESFNVIENTGGELILMRNKHVFMEFGTCNGN